MLQDGVKRACENLFCNSHTEPQRTQSFTEEFESIRFRLKDLCETLCSLWLCVKKHSTDRRIPPEYDEPLRQKQYELLFAFMCQYKLKPL